MTNWCISRVLHIDKLGKVGKLQIFNNVRIIKKNVAQQVAIGYDQGAEDELHNRNIEI